jgi:hypothetical protein
MSVPGTSTTAIFQGSPWGSCDITANETVGQLDVDANYPKDNLTIESGATLTLKTGTAFSGIGQEIIVLGKLANTGGTMTDTAGNLIGNGEIVLNGGGMSFVNSAQVTVQTTISVDWQASTIDTLQLNNTAAIMLQPPTGSTTEPLIRVGVNGTLDVHIDNHGIIADPSTTAFTPIDLQGKLTKTGTLLSAPTNYYSIQAPIHVDGTYASMNIQGGDGLQFWAVQGSGAGSKTNGQGNRGQAVFQDGGTILLNNGSTLYAGSNVNGTCGMEMDNGTLTGYSNVTNGTASSWNVSLGTGNFYFVGGNIFMGGTNNGGNGAYDYGIFNMSSTGSGFLWYSGTLNVGVYSGGGNNNRNASILSVAGDINIEATGSGQAMAWAGGLPKPSPASYQVMGVTGSNNGVNNSITDGLNPANNPAPQNWSGGVNPMNNTSYIIGW